MRALLAEPPVREKKPPFYEVPVALVLRLQEVCGGEVRSVESVFGGFSASAGFILTLKTDEKFFVKGCHPADTSHGAQNLRQEVLAYETLPSLHKIAPPYLGVVSDGDEDGWMLGVWEHVEHNTKRGTPERAISTLESWEGAGADAPYLTACSEHTYIGGFFRNEKKWQRIKTDTAVREKFLSTFADPKASGWLEKNISALCALQAEGEKPFAQQGIIHGDLRIDNFLFTPAKTYIVDWPNICFGPRVFDVAMLYASLEAFGLCTFEHALSVWDGGVKSAEVAVMLGCFSGYFADQVYRRPPPAMPRLRWMQRCMLLAQLQYLSRLGFIESPPAMRDENQ